MCRNIISSRQTVRITHTNPPHSTFCRHCLTLALLMTFDWRFKDFQCIQWPKSNPAIFFSIYIHLKDANWGSLYLNRIYFYLIKIKHIRLSLYWIKSGVPTLIKNWIVPYRHSKNVKSVLSTISNCDVVRIEAHTLPCFLTACC